ncbi:MAG: hypothetical protein KGH57_04325 [Candidatus Micrarchaeota archaeon]|nr:hypothetical protein [Candidatus Micrarchaeota archaeon]
MGEKASLSVQQIADAGLRETGRTPSTAARRIAQLRNEAMEAREKRAGIIQALEGYIAERGTTGEAGAASRAVATIMTVSMLEILQGD